MKKIAHIHHFVTSVRILSFLLLLVISCDKKEDPILRLSQKLLEFKEIGGRQHIVVTTNQSSWKSIGTASWLELSEQKDELQITVQPNTAIEKRETSILIMAGSLLDTLTIQQNAAKPQLSLSDLEWSVGAEGGTTTILATTNENRLEAISSAEWVTVQIIDKVILLTSSKNTSIESRTCYIQVSAGNIKSRIEITQKGSLPQLSLSSENWAVSAKGGNTTVIITTNDIHPEVTLSAEWLTAVISDKTLTLTAQKNESTAPRSGYITVRAAGIEKKIKIEQEGISSSLSLSAYSWTVSAQGGNMTIMATTSENNLKITSSAEWLTATVVNKTITLTAKPNETIASRTAFITVQAAGIEKKIDVEQEGSVSILSLSTYNWKVTAQGGNTNVYVTTNNTNFKVASSASWLTTTVTGKTITLISEPNGTITPRTAYITVQVAGTEKNIVVEQDAATSSEISLSLNVWKPTSNSESTTVSVTTEEDNIQVFSSVDWLTASITGKTITLVTKANEATSTRTAYVTVKTLLAEARIEVIQAAALPTLSLSSENWNVASQGGNTSIIVTTNTVNLQAVSYASDWLTARVVNRTILLSATENKSTSSRTTIVKVTAGTVSASIIVVQAPIVITIKAPTVSTTAIRYGSDEVYTGGTIISDGGSPITSYGVCWNTAPTPTIINNRTIDGSGNNSFQSIIQERRVGIKVYVRAYATNAAGTSYGEEQTFDSNIFTDIDGNVYQAIQIGNQIWMNRNLRVKRYNTGALILNTNWGSGTDGKYIIPHSVQYEKWYGLLYNWYACIDVRNICPKGWHVPTSTEWRSLCSAMGGAGGAGRKLKSTDHNTFNWWDGDATNEVGFSAYPGGYCEANGTSKFETYEGHWWTQSEGRVNFGYYGVAAIMSYKSNGVIIDNYNKAFGRSVRCIRDE